VQVIRFCKLADRNLWRAALAGQLLPIVQSNPKYAYASEIARAHGSKLIGAPDGGDIGSALNWAEGEGLVKSETRSDPKGSTNDVRLYSLTRKGALMLALCPSVSLVVIDD
jgi:hypothetical protein